MHFKITVLLVIGKYHEISKKSLVLNAFFWLLCFHTAGYIFTAFSPCTREKIILPPFSLCKCDFLVK